MHDRESGIVVGRGSGVAGLHVEVELRPAHAENTADHAHQAVFNVGELRGLQHALAIDDDESVLIGGETSEIVSASEDGIGKALSGAARAGSDQGVGDRAVMIVNNADGGAGRS